MAFDEAAARDLDEAFDALLTGGPLPADQRESETMATLRHLHGLARSGPDPDFVRHLETTLKGTHAEGRPDPAVARPLAARATAGRRPLHWGDRPRRARGDRWWQAPAVLVCLLGIVLLGIASAGRDDAPRQVLPAAQPASPAVGPRAVLLVMDVSGSMSYDPQGGTSKIDQAKAAARATLAAIEPGAWFGLLAFNDEQRWVVPLAELGPADQRQEAERAIDAITPDGGTEIYPALSAGLSALRSTPAGERHLVLLTDGKSRTGTRESYQRLIADSAGDNVALSTIAIGADADLELAQFLAEIGGGQYWYVESPENILRALATILDLPIATPAA
jgi:hypothetical protein